MNADQVCAGHIEMPRPRTGRQEQLVVAQHVALGEDDLARSDIDPVDARAAPELDLMLGVEPIGMHVRVDSGLYTGYKVPPYYDSMIAKLIVYGTTRERCLMRLRRALEEFVIEGMKTTIPLHAALLDDPEFQQGAYTIKWLEEWLAKQDAR